MHGLFGFLEEEVGGFPVVVILSVVENLYGVSYAVLRYPVAFRQAAAPGFVCLLIERRAVMACSIIIQS